MKMHAASASHECSHRARARDRARCVSHASSARHSRAPVCVPTELFNNLGVKVSKDKVKEMFAEVDEDGSGEIDFEEFLVLVAKQVAAEGQKDPYSEAMKGAQSAKSAVPLRSMCPLIPPARSVSNVRHRRQRDN